MNQVHDRSCSDPVVARLRVLLEEIDKAVVSAYGWDRQQINYDFRDIQGGGDVTLCRWSIPQSSALVLFRNLLELNKQRDAEEKQLAQLGGKPHVRQSRVRKSANVDFTLDLDDILLNIVEGGD